MLKKYLKIFIPTGIALAIILFLILFFNIPRVTYKYVEEYDGYFVNNVYGNASTYEIKNEHKGKEVVGISTRAFFKKNKLKSISLPENIKIIDRLAFSECKNLERINLENVNTIYRNAFSYCNSLKDLNIGAEYIGASAFYKCENLKNVTLTNTLSIGSMAFSETKIKNIILPKSVIEVGSDCFYNCFLLENISVYGNNLKDNVYLKTLNIVTYIS